MSDHQHAVTQIVHACFNSYVDKDGWTIEALIAGDFQFTNRHSSMAKI